MEGRRLAVVLIVTSCLSALTVGDTRSVPDVCLQPMDVGPCERQLPRYYFNAVQVTCKRFDYGGCGGNQNRFNSKDDCLKKCLYSLT
uniref:G038_VD_Conkunitzin_precursor_conopeptide n=1 Tax=Conus geographus TaxID=6491 RepID=X5IGV6_CONGE|nr:G038_VD_Conkunitzin_precursor_conopeptide [Conus geographus]